MHDLDFNPENDRQAEVGKSFTLSAMDYHDKYHSSFLLHVFLLRLLIRVFDLLLVRIQDRCHRIGQTRAVRVYRLVTGDTVDEDIYEMGEDRFLVLLPPPLCLHPLLRTIIVNPS